MAHFAQLDSQGLVLQVIVVNNAVITNPDGTESEALGIAFCKELFGANTLWAQTSYNARFRKNYAGVGYTFDATRDAFIQPKPFASWVLNESTCQWEAPIPYPNDGQFYCWDENTHSWVLVDMPPL